MTLLVFVYKSDKKIPIKPIEFYDSLFTTVLSRHDKNKPGGVNRNRKTTISDTCFQKIFDCVSFLSSQDSKTSMRELEAIRYIEKAREYIGEGFNSEDYLSDVCQITCLIMKDGFDYSFLHKSIQEYHAAKFIASIPESKAVDFYSKISDSGEWRKWREQVGFLVELDKYRCNKFFVIETCTQDQHKYFDSRGRIDKDVWLAIIDGSYLGLFKREKGESFSVEFMTYTADIEMVLDGSYALNRWVPHVFSIFNSYGIDESKLLSSLNEEQGSGIKFSELIKKLNAEDYFYNNFSSSLQSKIDEVKEEAQATVNQLESTDTLFDF